MKFIILGKKKPKENKKVFRWKRKTLIIKNTKEYQEGFRFSTEDPNLLDKMATSSNICLMSTIFEEKCLLRKEQIAFI